MKTLLTLIFCLAALIISFNAGCKSPTEPPIKTTSTIPQWGMFRHDARHTGNVNTLVEGITGPSGDSVTVKWKVPIDGGLIGSPAIGADGTIYFGTENALNWDSSSVYAINPEGTVKWRYTPIHRIWSSPAIGNDGSIYVGTDNGLCAFTESGNLKWKSGLGQAIISSPAIGKDGTVYYTNKDYLNAVNPADGSIKWQVTGGDYYCSPAIASDGTIYYSNYGTITAVKPNGTVEWKYADSTYLKQHIFAVEIGYDGTIYFLSGDSPYLYALNNQGKLKWKYLGGNALADPAIDIKGNIYVITNNSSFYALNSNGQQEWEITFPSNGVTRSPLVIENNGIVYIGVSGDWNGNSLFAYNQSKLLWTFGSGYPYNDGGVTASPSIYNGSLYFAWDSGQYYYFYCLQ